MGLFETANELVVLDGGRRLEWSDDSAFTSKPTNATDGLNVSNAIVVGVYLEPAAGAYPTFDLYGYIGTEESGPGAWSPIEKNVPTDGEKTVALFRDTGEYDQVAVVASGVANLKIGKGIPE